MNDSIPDDVVRRVQIQNLERLLLIEHTRLVQAARAVHAVRDNIDAIERELEQLKQVAL